MVLLRLSLVLSSCSAVIVVKANTLRDWLPRKAREKLQRTWGFSAYKSERLSAPRQGESECKECLGMDEASGPTSDPRRG